MPTKTSARPRSTQSPAGAARRFGRSTATPPPRASRLPSRTPATTPRFRGKKQPAKSAGLAGLLSALPITGAAKPGKRSSGGGGGKAKPAFALLAAGAGALLGRKQMKKRKDDAATPAPPAPAVYTAPPAAASGEAPLPPAA